jgi:hypothetical protein
MTLFRDALSDHLTEAPADQAARRTHPGMAHFAGSGPQSRSCRECEFWGASFNPTRTYSYAARRGMSGGMLKPHSCEKARQLTQGAIGGKIPHDAAACKYFKHSDNPPPLVNK